MKFSAKTNKTFINSVIDEKQRNRSNTRRERDGDP